MSFRIDLHTHSTASDGQLRPSEVVRFARQLGLTTLALTDHDTTDGVIEAQQAGAELGLEVIAGIEINSEGEHGDAHILGYFVDPSEPCLQEPLEAIRDARVGRAKGILKKLGEMGMPLEWKRVMAIAGDAVSIARPHVARAMVEAGYVASTQEAFDKYISNDGPAYVNRFRLTMSEAIGLIHGAGGVAVIGHPAQSKLVHLIPQLVQAGLDGIEVFYPDHTPEQQAELLEMAARYNLVVTGGSDFHTLADSSHGMLGSVEVPTNVVDKLKARLVLYKQGDAF
jgi:predicted metal-dependent phosphoesterase TrpH